MTHSGFGDTPPEDVFTEGADHVMTAAGEALDAIQLWVNDGRAAGSGGYAVRGDTVVVRWKGQPPRALLQYVETLGVTVLVECTKFSGVELLRAAERVITRFPEVVSSAGVAEDASGIEVTLLPEAAADGATQERSIERLRNFVDTSSEPVPLEVTGVMDAPELVRGDADFAQADHPGEHSRAAVQPPPRHHSSDPHSAVGYMRAPDVAAGSSPGVEVRHSRPAEDRRSQGVVPEQPRWAGGLRARHPS